MPMVEESLKAQSDPGFHIYHPKAGKYYQRPDRFVVPDGWGDMSLFPKPKSQKALTKHVRNISRQAPINTVGLVESIVDPRFSVLQALVVVRTPILVGC